MQINSEKQRGGTGTGNCCKFIYQLQNSSGPQQPWFTVLDKTRQHAETRLLALLLWDVLFCRSAAFREATAARIQEFVLLTIGDDRRSDASLPPPRDAAAALRARAIEMFEGWHDAHAKCLGPRPGGWRFR